MLVGVDDERIALALRHGDGHDLLREHTVLLGGDGALVRLHGQGVLVLAADGELGAQVLAVSIMPPGTGKSRPPAVTRARARRSDRATASPLTPQRMPVA